MNNINPIDLALATCLAITEALLWVINELLGFHAQPEAAEPALEAPTTAAKPALRVIDPRRRTQALRVYYQQLTVKELQEYTGIKSSRYNKARLVECAIEA